MADYVVTVSDTDSETVPAFALPEAVIVPLSRVGLPPQTEDDAGRILTADGDGGYLLTDGIGDLDTAAAALVDDPGSALGVALSSTYARPLANTFVLFGTSLEEQNRDGTDSLDPSGALPAPVNARGWAHWANAFSGGGWRMVRNAGVSGNTYTQMLARIQADVLAYPSDWVWIGGPINDISSGAGRTAAAIIADATAILDALKDRRVLILTAPPSTAYDTASKKAVLTAVNQWIRDLPRTRPGVVVVDAWRVLVDTATGNPATGMTSDGIQHYSQAGAARIGKAAAAALAPWVMPAPRRVSFTGDPASVVANPAFATNGSGWSATASVTAAYTADDETFSNKAVLTFSGNTGAGDLGITCNEVIGNGRYAVGDVIQLSARVKWSNIVPVGVVSRIGPVVRCRQFDNNSVFLTDSQTIGLWDSDSNRVIPNGFPSSGEVIVRTHKNTIQNPAAGHKQLSYLLGFVGIASGTVEISDFAAVKV